MRQRLLVLVALFIVTTIAVADEGDASIILMGPDMTVVQYEDSSGLRANIAALRSRKGIIFVNSFNNPNATAIALNMVTDRWTEPVHSLIITNPTIERNGGNQLFSRYNIIAHKDAQPILTEIFASEEKNITEKRIALANLNKELDSRLTEDSPKIDEMKKRQQQLKLFLKAADVLSLTMPTSKVYRDNSMDLFDKIIHVKLVNNAFSSADLIVIFEEEKAVICGDILVNGSLPVWDVEMGGSLKGMIAAMDKLLTLDGNYQRVIPGYGAPGGFEIVINQKRYLLDLLATVKQFKAENKSLEDAYQTLAEKYATTLERARDLKAGLAQAWTELAK